MYSACYIVLPDENAFWKVRHDEQHTQEFPQATQFHRSHNRSSAVGGISDFCRTQFRRTGSNNANNLREFCIHGRRFLPKNRLLHCRIGADFHE